MSLLWTNRGRGSAAYRVLGLLVALLLLCIVTTIRVFALASTAHGSAIRLTSLHMITPMVGWAENDSSMFHTADGGRSWTNANPPGFQGFTGNMSRVTFDANHAWVATRGSTSADVVLHTIDAGRTWKRVDVHVADKQEFAPEFSSLVVSNDRYVWLTTSYAGLHEQIQGIFSTDDGGVRWRRIGRALPISAVVALLTPRVALGIRGGGGAALPAIYRSTDTGHSWHRSLLALPHGYQTDTLQIVPPTFSGPQRGVLPTVAFYETSKRNAALIVYSTDDGGVHWKSGSPLVLDTRAPHVVVTFADAEHGWVGIGTALFTTSLAGRQWRRVASALRFNSGSPLQLVTAEVGFALTGRSVGIGYPMLSRTNDGGRTWVSWIPRRA